MRLRLTLLAIGLLVGCVDADPPALRTLVTVIATQEGQPVEEATQRIAKQGPRALVVIEAALHTAEPKGRRQLVRAIERIADRDAAALLRHLARYDEDATVRAAADKTLRSLGWTTP